MLKDFKSKSSSHLAGRMWKITLQKCKSILRKWIYHSESVAVVVRLRKLWHLPIKLACLEKHLEVIKHCEQENVNSVIHIKKHWCPAAESQLCDVLFDFTNKELSYSTSYYQRIKWSNYWLRCFMAVCSSSNWFVNTKLNLMAAWKAENWSSSKVGCTWFAVNGRNHQSGPLHFGISTLNKWDQAGISVQLFLKIRTTLRVKDNAVFLAEQRPVRLWAVMQLSKVQ